MPHDNAMVLVAAVNSHHVPVVGVITILDHDEFFAKLTCGSVWIECGASISLIPGPRLDYTGDEADSADYTRFNLLFLAQQNWHLFLRRIFGRNTVTTIFNDWIYINILLPKVQEFLKLWDKAWNWLKTTHAYDLVVQWVLENIISLSKKQTSGIWRVLLGS